MYLEIYVHSLLGDDKGAGTPSKPYKTVKKAVDEVANMNFSDLSDDFHQINIVLGNGVNKIESTVKLSGFGENVTLVFKPWDGMYTTLSCTKRVDGHGFVKLADSEEYAYPYFDEFNSLYINGAPVTLTENPDKWEAGTVYVDFCKSKIVYRPAYGNNPDCSTVEFGGWNTMFEISDCSDVVFQNVEFTGIGDASNEFISLCGKSNVSFDKCKFKNAYCPIVNSLTALAYIRMSGCEITNLKAQCFKLNSASEIKIEGSYFEKCSEEIVWANNSERINILENTFSDSFLPLVDAKKNIHMIELIRNRIENPTRAQRTVKSNILPDRLNLDSNCVIFSSQSSKSKSDIYFDSEFMKSNIVVGYDEWLTYNKFMETNAILTFNENPIGSEADQEPLKTAGLDLCHAKRFGLIKNAGYRKTIYNYGDII